MIAITYVFMYNDFGDEMIIDLIRLKSNIDEYIFIDMEYTFDKELLEETDLLGINNVLIKGFITKDVMDNYIIEVNVSGVMILPCSVTLEPVDYPFSIKIEGILDEILQEIDENNKKVENSIDILPIIWENILMEIPMKVTSDNISNIKTKGDGWAFVTEDVQEKPNPELEKLKDLL